MLHAIIMKFPGSVLDEQSQTMFVHLVVSLANDHDNKVRSMTGAAIKLLIGRVSSHSLHSILEYSLSWYVGEKQHLWSAAAQVKLHTTFCGEVLSLLLFELMILLKEEILLLRRRETINMIVIKGNIRILSA